MRYSKIRKRVFLANKMLASSGLVVSCQGNASEFDPEKNIVAIKPSGVPYGKLRKRDIVIVDLSGKKIDGKLSPSTDLMTHLEIYKSFPLIRGIVHTHSVWATSWAQANSDLPVLGTTHADFFPEPIPCVRNLSTTEVKINYEKNTGATIVERIMEYDTGLLPPAVLVPWHGVFSFGNTSISAVNNAICLENIAELAHRSLQIKHSGEMPNVLIKKHYYRKHGDNAYYGQ